MRKNTWSHEHEGKRIWSCIYAGGIVSVFDDQQVPWALFCICSTSRPTKWPNVGSEFGLCVRVINWASTASLSSWQTRSRTHLVSSCHQWSQEVAINKKIQKATVPRTTIWITLHETHTSVWKSPEKTIHFLETPSIQSWWMAIRIPACDILDDRKIKNDKWYSRVESSCELPEHSVDGRNPPVDSVDSYIVYPIIYRVSYIPGGWPWGSRHQPWISGPEPLQWDFPWSIP